MASIKDVAARAGVSTATVSRVMANKSHIRPEIRDRVLAVVEELNYRPNRVARSLRVQRSSAIALIVSDIRNPFFTAVSRAVEDVAYQHGLSVMLCNTDEDPQKEALYLDLVQGERVAGVIFSPTLRIAETFGQVVDLSVPLVVIDRRVSGRDVDSVLLDNEDAAYRLVDHLIGHGRRRIGGFFGIGSTTGRERREGYLRALQDHDLPLIPELVHYMDAKADNGYRAAQKLLGLPVPPDALFTSNGVLSTGAFRALRDSRVAIPDDIAFASFDETMWTPLVEPAVTVIEQPTYEIGQIAAELLLRRIEEPTRPTRQVILKGKLVVRQSCGAHPETDDISVRSALRLDV